MKGGGGGERRKEREAGKMGVRGRGQLCYILAPTPYVLQLLCLRNWSRSLLSLATEQIPFLLQLVCSGFLDVLYIPRVLMTTGTYEPAPPFPPGWGVFCISVVRGARARNYQDCFC